MDVSLVVYELIVVYCRVVKWINDWGICQEILMLFDFSIGLSIRAEHIFFVPEAMAFIHTTWNIKSSFDWWHVNSSHVFILEVRKILYLRFNSQVFCCFPLRDCIDSREPRLNIISIMSYDNWGLIIKSYGPVPVLKILVIGRIFYFFSKCNRTVFFKFIIYNL